MKDHNLRPLPLDKSNPSAQPLVFSQPAVPLASVVQTITIEVDLKATLHAYGPMAVAPKHANKSDYTEPTFWGNRVWKQIRKSNATVQTFVDIIALECWSPFNFPASRNKMDSPYKLIPFLVSCVPLLIDPDTVMWTVRDVAEDQRLLVDVQHGSLSVESRRPDGSVVLTKSTPEGSALAKTLDQHYGTYEALETPEYCKPYEGNYKIRLELDVDCKAEFCDPTILHLPGVLDFAVEAEIRKLLSSSEDSVMYCGPECCARIVDELYPSIDRFGLPYELLHDRPPYQNSRDRDDALDRRDQLFLDEAIEHFTGTPVQLERLDSIHVCESVLSVQRALFIGRSKVSILRNGKQIDVQAY
jgi:hypothetical protein